MIHNSIKKAIRYSAISFGIISILSACSNYEEPVNNLTEMKKTTRSEISSSPRTITQSEAVYTALEQLEFNTVLPPDYTVEYVIASNPIDKPTFLSDTLAYVINFKNNLGYAVISNDSRIFPVLAYGKDGNLTVKEGQIDDKLLKNIEIYFSKKCTSFTNDTNIPDYCGGYEHCIIPRKIETKVHEGEPFNKFIKKEHLDCNAGTAPACSAILMSYSLEETIYCNVAYDFPSINYCLMQGPGFNPVYPGLQPLNSSKFPTTFTYSYGGSVNAMATLMYDLGKAMETSYSKDNSITDVSKVYSVLKGIGCPVTKLYNKYDVQEIWSLVYTNHLIFQSAIDKSTHKEICFIIDGGENLYTQNRPYISNAFSAFTYIPTPELYDNEFSGVFLDLLEQYGYEFKEYFGVKINI